MWSKTKTPGVRARHQNDCASHNGGKCRCQKSYQARYKDDKGKWQWSATVADESRAIFIRAHGESQQTPEAKSTKLGKSFNTLTDEWYALAESGGVSQKGGRRYSKGTLDTYRRMYKNHVREGLGQKDAAKLTTLDWQHWLEGMSLKGLKKNSITPTLNIVRSVYRWACSPTRLILTFNPTRGLELPANDETARNRVATPEEARKLLAAIEGCDRTSFGLALYAGMRNVERKPLDWTDVDFKGARVRVRVTKGGDGAGIRSLPITAPLRTILREEWMRQGRPLSGLVCRGPKGGAPEYDSMKTRAQKAWEKLGLTPIGFHESRHTFITMMILSGLNMKAVSVLAGHASIAITADRYGHLFPGHEDEAGRMLNDLYAKGEVAIAS